MNNYKVIIVGGGASGIMCAIRLLGGDFALNGQDILILERNDRVAKKILVTGNGQCNVTNKNLTSSFFHGKKPFIDGFISNLNKYNIVSQLNDLGLPLCTGKDGKMYPVSKQAGAVVDVFRSYLSEKGCVVLTGKRVESIEKMQDGFSVRCGTDIFRASFVVVAVGGSAGKQFGTDGSSYSLLQPFGHKITPLYPSLVQIKTSLEKIRGLKGLKENARVSAYDGDKLLKSVVGDVLFTEYGLSGSAVFEVSGYLATAKKSRISLCFLPDMPDDEIIKTISDRAGAACFGGKDALLGLLNKKVGQAVCGNAKSLSAKDLLVSLRNFDLSVTGSLGFNYAQVTKGGVDTDGINRSTYESLLQKGLYVIGETLDVDGDCGGYNLTFAFVSAMACADDIKAKTGS